MQKLTLYELLQKREEKRREEKEETAFYQKSENFGDVLESIFQAREIPP